MTLGYKNVIHNRIIDGNRIDITAERELPLGTVIKYIIECKDYSSNVGIEEVNKFALVFNNLRNLGKVHKGVIVSKSGFTAQGRQAAEAYGLELYEYDSLLKKAKEEGLPPENVELIKEDRPNRKYVFVIMPFDKEFDDIYYFGIRGAVEKAHLYCERVDDINYTGGVVEKVTEQIRKADIIVAEMSGRNPNVFYEVGLAHAWKRDTILIVKNAEEIPYDLRGQNHIVYNGSIKTLESKLTDRLMALKYK